MDQQSYGISGAGQMVALVGLLQRGVGLPARWAGLVAVTLGMLLAALLKRDSRSLGTLMEVTLTSVPASL